MNSLLRPPYLNRFRPNHASPRTFVRAMRPPVGITILDEIAADVAHRPGLLRGSALVARRNPSTSSGSFGQKRSD
jgi:hypothetical protein